LGGGCTTLGVAAQLHVDVVGRIAAGVERLAVTATPLASFLEVLVDQQRHADRVVGDPVVGPPSKVRNCQTSRRRSDRVGMSAMSVTTAE
jgi:hypothetical protein